MPELTEIRWHARAGQGAKTRVADPRARAHARSGKSVQSFPEYGPGAPRRAAARVHALQRRAAYAVTTRSSEPDLVVVLDDVAASDEPARSSRRVLVGRDDARSLVACHAAARRRGHGERRDARRGRGRARRAVARAAAGRRSSRCSARRSPPEALRAAAAEGLRDGGAEAAGTSFRARARCAPADAARPVTGDWRTTGRPVLALLACVNCLLCWLYCPDSAIVLDGTTLAGIDYDYCKGCELCVEVCPVERDRDGAGGAT